MTIQLRMIFPVLLITLLASIAGHSVLAQDEDDTRVQPSMVYAYGSDAQFVAEITSPSIVNRALLYMRVQGRSSNPILAETIQGDPAIAIVVLDLRSNSLSPFASVEYWWQIDFSDGSSIDTIPISFIYEDNRFQWRYLTDPPVTIHWIENYGELGRAALSDAKRSLDNARLDIGLATPAEFHIYLYPSVDFLQSALRLGGRRWVNGHADPELGVVLLAIPEGPEERLTLERDLPHEITHVLLYERMREHYDNLPKWLEEGLATLEEIAPRPEYRLALESAVQDENFLPMETLCTSFPINEEEALLSYAQSASFITYLIELKGPTGLIQLVDAYQEGTPCSLGIERIYQRSIAQLEAEWKRTAFEVPGLASTLQPILPWLLLSLPALAIILISFIPRDKSKPPPLPIPEDS
jgi:hypothetical protein